MFSCFGFSLHVGKYHHCLIKWYGEGAVPPNSQVLVTVGGTAPSLYQAERTAPSLYQVSGNCQIRCISSIPITTSGRRETWGNTGGTRSPCCIPWNLTNTLIAQSKACSPCQKKALLPSRQRKGARCTSSASTLSTRGLYTST